MYTKSIGGEMLAANFARWVMRDGDKIDRIVFILEYIFRSDRSLGSPIGSVDLV
jgi:hypothetical protein